MRERRRLQMMAQLVAVQRARRCAAEDALGQAQERERQAQARRQESADREAAADEEWSSFIAAPGFSPELGRSLAGRVIEAGDKAQAAEATLRAAEQVRTRREGEWQELEAQVRTGERSLKRLKRRTSRATEEQRLAEQADQTTFSRCRP